LTYQFKHLKPGGYFEHAEFSVETNASPTSDKHADKIYTAFSNSIIDVGESKTGMTFKTLEHMKTWMEEAGFVDVVERRFVWPIGAWPKDKRLKDMGRWGERNWTDGLEGWVLALYTRVLGVSSLSNYEDLRCFALLLGCPGRESKCTALSAPVCICANADNVIVDLRRSSGLR
jgi:hypothetical protein